MGERFGKMCNKWQSFGFQVGYRMRVWVKDCLGEWLGGWVNGKLDERLVGRTGLMGSNGRKYKTSWSLGESTEFSRFVITVRFLPSIWHITPNGNHDMQAEQTITWTIILIATKLYNSAI